MKKLGLIVNPVAGMGGRVGLKGSDGLEILKKAKELGAVPEAPNRAIDALKKLLPIKGELTVITYPFDMGEDEVIACGLKHQVIGTVKRGETTPEDTKQAAREMVELGVDLILFAGGDGTARNIYDAIGTGVPVIGIPAGVKIHSAVYATTPPNAGELALMFLQGRLQKIQEAEVMDIDEDAFREGRVTAKLYGYLSVPHEDRLVQSLKSGRAEGEASAIRSIAGHIAETMENDPETLYIIGPGTTTRAIMEELNQPYTLLGVDVVCNQKLLAADVTEKALLQLIQGRKAKIVVTVIGGQGYIFGRGNQQLSPAVLRQVGKENVIVITPQTKITGLRGKPMLIDTGDEEVNRLMSGYYQVVVGYQRTIMYKAE